MVQFKPINQINPNENGAYFSTQLLEGEENLDICAVFGLPIDGDELDHQQFRSHFRTTLMFHVFVRVESEGAFRFTVSYFLRKQDRYPPIVSQISRPSVPCAPEPWVLSKFKKRGYAYSDVLYAINMRECEPEDFLDAIRRYPIIRLSKAVTTSRECYSRKLNPIGPSRIKWN